MNAAVVELYRYPVKGCAGTAVSRAQLVSTGVAGDRMFMLTDPDGGVLTQRRAPRMAVISPSLVDDGAGLVLRAPGFPDFRLEVSFDAARTPVNVFGWSGKSVDQGHDVAEWLSAALGVRCRLVRAAPEHDRTAGGLHPSQVGFADSSSLLITSLSTLEELNRRISDRGGEPVPMARFRPNIVLHGWQRPHTEDVVRSMSIGSATLGFGKDCVRCVVATVDQETGRKAGPEPLRTLATYRRTADGGVRFGMKAAVLRPGTLAVGDEVTVHEWAEVDEP